MTNENILRRSRRVSLGTSALCGAMLLFPSVGVAQDHHNHHSHHGHHHAGGPVECRTLAAPPWSGLSPADREAIRRVEASVERIRSPEAATRAGFTPRFGNIPTMGVHWVNERRMRDGFRLEEPDHLLFAPVNGEETLVGIAYAFRGPFDAKMPGAFESDLAHWHDHPELGGPGQTLHMLHVWFVPSPYGPFAGNNFFLPFLGGGIHLPNPCWIESDEDVERLELVASLVEILNRHHNPEVARGASARRGQGPGALRGVLVRSRIEVLAERLEEHLVALDRTAQAGDRDGWIETADKMLESLRPGERQIIETLRDRVTGIQSSRGVRGRG